MATKTIEQNPRLLTWLKTNETRELNKLVDDIVDAVATTKAAEAQEKEVKGLLRGMVLDEYWNTNFGEGQPIHTFDVANRKTVLQLNFLDKYFVTPEKANEFFEAFSGDDKLTGLLELHTKLTVDLSPLNKDTVKLLAFLREAQALYRKYGLDGKVDDGYQFVEGFHNKRHGTLTPGINKRINEIVPVQVQVTV